MLSIGELSNPCGHCDRCSSFYSQYKDWSNQASYILSELRNDPGINVTKLVAHLSKRNKLSKAKLNWLVRRLVQEQLIKETNDGSQRLFLNNSGNRFLDQPWPLNYINYIP